MELTQIDEKTVNQIRKDIFYLIKKSYNTKNVDAYNSVYSDIMAYVELLDELDINCDDIFKYILPETREDNLDKCIKQHYIECEKSIDFDTKIIDNLSDTLIDTDYIHGNFTNITEKISKDKMYDYAFEFFENYKPILHNQLNNMLKENRIILLKNIGQNYNGKTICSTFKFSPYIVIYTFNNVMDVEVLIHEMGHVYHHQKQNQFKGKQVYKTICNYQLEVYSHYLELLSYDYFLDKVKKQDILNLKRLTVKNLIQNYINLEFSLSYLDKKNYKENYSQYCSDYSYGRGMLLAFEFYDMYQKDKEQADFNIEHFLSETGKYDFLTTIDKYGLNKEHIESCEAVKKYIKEIF